MKSKVKKLFKKLGFEDPGIEMDYAEIAAQSQNR